jgi:HK97 gp10 family phage protein
MTMRVNTSSFLAGMRAALDNVSEAIGEDALRAAGFAGAEVLRNEAKLNASRHVDTGTLMNNIIVKRVEEKSDGARLQTYYVMVRNGKMFREGDAFYWRWVENGHKIVPRKPKKTTWKQHRAAAALEYGNRRVPGYAFMRNAFDAKNGEAVEAMRAALSRALSEGTGGT